ncbi:LysR family transcriptional regulator [Microbacterium sp. STN6]|uniref:LysR family transcriptional regulator n=1 Tax=Microbacterium sp. STN6 TaxID=2995588 RepID=UPI0022608889|nr:LysR family transcriptional regulator [Microbacterium sp. STN6]MCX7520766.1 LysR family transcriptional regulator [Microbacterium sp. STN6]
MEVSSHALRYFLAVARELHFARAAEALHISPPSLSQQILRLEQQVGRPLFVRTSRAVELTDAGRALVPLATRAVDAGAAVSEWIEQLERQAQPLLRLGFVVGMGGALTTRIIGEATRRIEGLRIEMQRLDFVNQLDALRERRVDAVFIPEEVQPIPHDVDVTVVYTEPRVLVVSDAHPLAGRRSVRLDETSAETYITVSGMTPERTDAWLVNPRPDGTRLRMGSQATDIEGIIELCAAGVGVNIAGAAVREAYSRPGIAFVPIDDLAPSRFVLCTRSDAFAGSALTTFVAIVREAAAAP